MSWLSDLLTHKHKWKKVGLFSPSGREGSLDVLSCSCDGLAYVEDYNTILSHWMYHKADCDCPWCEMFHSEKREYSLSF